MCKDGQIMVRTEERRSPTSVMRTYTDSFRKYSCKDGKEILGENCVKGESSLYLRWTWMVKDGNPKFIR